MVLDRGPSMPWRELSVMDQREEFVGWRCSGSEHEELCRRFGISRAATATSGSSGSWRGDGRSLPIARAVRIAARRARPSGRSGGSGIRESSNNAWGGRKIAAGSSARRRGVPSPSTITAILRRHGSSTSAPASIPVRSAFRAAQPNELWQMDFKGALRARRGGRCHPLTVLDDHSRYSLGLRGLRQRAGRPRCRRLIAGVSPLWPAGRDADGQRLAVGRFERRALYRP